MHITNNEHYFGQEPSGVWVVRSSPSKGPLCSMCDSQLLFWQHEMNHAREHADWLEVWMHPVMENNQEYTTEVSLHLPYDMKSVMAQTFFATTHERIADQVWRGAEEQ